MSELYTLSDTPFRADESVSLERYRGNVLLIYNAAAL
jgi:glutathione peroxidase-family protein